MKDRIKEVRKASSYGKTQDSFSEYLGISKSNLASYESGRRTPSDAVIQLICQKCNINENWLKSGTGSMKISLTRNQEIGAFANDVMKLDDEKFKKRFVEALTKLDERDWEALEIIIDKLTKEGD
ncbi:MAG: helix-turn-helix transcriptional regulator [Lachnospiraceae bacterium]|nr:helix-turn-helix transcriptional regulator [Lachnospiraceae bacterium]